MTAWLVLALLVAVALTPAVTVDWRHISTRLVDMCNYAKRIREDR